MTPTKKVKKSVPKIRKYDDGYFVGAEGTNHMNGIATGLNTAAGIINSTTNQKRVNVGASTGSGALSGAATGATIGTEILPGIGTVIGGAAGAIGGAAEGYFGSESELREQQYHDSMFNSGQLQQISNGMNKTNINPYGTQMYALGDIVSDPTPVPPPPPLSPKNYLVNYMNSPIYNKRLSTSGSGSKPQSLEDIYNTNIIHSNDFPSAAIDKGKANQYNPVPVRYKVNNIVINPNQIKSDGGNEDEFQAHELSHLERNLTSNEQNIIIQRNKSPEGLDLLKKYNESGKKVDLSTFISGLDPRNSIYHDQKPNENKADLDALRYQMYKNGIYDTSKGDLDLPTLQKALSNPDIQNSHTTKRLLENFKPEDLVYLNNTIASTGDTNTNNIEGNIGNYAFGGMISHNPVEVTGKFNQPNIGMKHFAPHLTPRTRVNNPLVNKFENGSDILDNNPNNQSTTDVTNTQQNTINIQKGELLIHPETGKILQNYQGINPLTGGVYEPHSKGKTPESPNNFTLADPGLFVITKKTSKQYKEAMDNNDKISQKTVLMNIRNAKIQKQGGLKPKNYADGDYIDNSNGDPNLNPNAFIPMNPITGLINSTKIQTPVSYAGLYNPSEQSRINNQVPISTTIPSSTHTIVATKSNNTLSNITDGLQKYGPALVNLAEGTFGQTQTQPYSHAAINPYVSQVQANMPKDIDMGPVINDIRSTQNLENKNIENNTNNSAVNRANRQQVAANTNKSLINARLQGQELNNQTAGQRAYMYNALGYQDVQDQQQRRQYDLGVDDINNRRQSAKQNLFNAGLSQLQQIGMNDKQNQQKAGMDKYTLGLMQQIFPNLKYYDDFDADKVNKMLGR